MTTTATDLQKTQYATSATFTCGKVEAYVSRYTDGRWRVIVLNSSHATWRGMGKGFASHAEALAGYKSGSMKAILSAALEMLAV